MTPEERLARLEANAEHLRERIDTGFLLLRREMEKAFDAAERALDIADKLRTRRDEGQNEWRATVSDFESRTVSRSTWDADRVAVDRRISGLEVDRATEKGAALQRADENARGRWLFGIGVTLVNILVSLFFRYGPLGGTTP